MNEWCVCMHWLLDPLSSHCYLTFTVCSFIRTSLSLLAWILQDQTVLFLSLHACMPWNQVKREKTHKPASWSSLLSSCWYLSPLSQQEERDSASNRTQKFSWSQRRVVWQLCLSTIWTCASIPAERRRRWWKNFQVEPQTGRRQQRLGFKNKKKKKMIRGWKEGRMRCRGRERLCMWMYDPFHFHLRLLSFLFQSEQQLLAILFCISYFTITLRLLLLSIPSLLSSFPITCGISK